MKVKSSVIVTLVRLLLIQGLDLNVSAENSTAESNRRVLFGEDANPADFEFLVKVERGDMFCGGTIISSHFIVTAAHCMKNYECRRIAIYPSTWVLGAIPRFYALECWTPEQYKSSIPFYYDIALIRTQEDLLQYQGQKRLPLPSPDRIYPVNTPAVVVGWGITEDNILAPHLRRAVVLVEAWNTCNHKWTQFPPTCEPNMNCGVRDIPRRGLCTRGQDPRPSNTCLGDSGGPVIINGELAGVVVGSIAKDNVCAIGTPALHTSVVPYLPWIFSVVAPGTDTSHFPVVDEAL